MLRDSARRHEAAPIHAVLAPNYYIARDFGGSFDPSASPLRNFSATYEFDNARLRPEYRDHGWNAFRRVLSGDRFEKKAGWPAVHAPRRPRAQALPAFPSVFSQKRGRRLADRRTHQRRRLRLSPSASSQGLTGVCRHRMNHFLGALRPIHSAMVRVTDSSMPRNWWYPPLQGDTCPCSPPSTPMNSVTRAAFKAASTSGIAS